MKAKAVAILLLLAILLSGAVASPAAHGTQKERRERAKQTELAEGVRAEFLHAWRGYEQYAWGHDALKPLSKTHH
ncbi:MAG: glycoside hydrolase family 47 protein, partial [Acidobacteriota bacterium]|nr:glycoside hydrolase family 47 protein [Acidobacteriota bacterium]